MGQVRISVFVCGCNGGGVLERKDVYENKAALCEAALRRVSDPSAMGEDDLPI